MVLCSNGGTFVPDYFSSFGGIWQTSGLAEMPGFFLNLPVFPATDSPHTVAGDYRYTLGIGLKGQNAGFWGFRVTYTLPTP